jgi:hypothetical protein
MHTSFVNRRRKAHEGPNFEARVNPGESYPPRTTLLTAVTQGDPSNARPPGILYKRMSPVFEARLSSSEWRTAVVPEVPPSARVLGCASPPGPSAVVEHP